MNNINREILRFGSRMMMFLVAFAIGYFLLFFITANLGLFDIPKISRLTNVPVEKFYRGSSSLLRFREIDNYHDVHILFAGSSHCMRGFDTRIYKSLGITSFNLGTTSQSPLNTYYLLMKYLPVLRPKSVILEVNPLVFSGDGTESVIDLVGNKDIDINLVEMALATKNILAVNTLLYSLLDLNLTDAKMLQSDLDKSDKYISGGFLATSKTSKFNSNLSTDFSFTYNPTQYSYLEDIIEMVKSCGVNVSIVSTPMRRNFLERITTYEEWKNKIRSICSRKEVIFLDYCDDDELTNPVLFYDEHHLTEKGVQLFNKKFIADLYN